MAMLQVGFSRALNSALLPLIAFVGAIVAGAEPGVVVLLLLAFLVTLGLATFAAMAAPVLVRGRALSVRGREQVTRGPGGTVDLAQLTRARSVSYHGGLVSGRGLALFRNQIELEDAQGGRVMFGAWGWTPRREFRTLLRQAVVDCHARMDPMTWWRLGFGNDQGARVSPIRRLI